MCQVYNEKVTYFQGESPLHNQVNSTSTNLWCLKKEFLDYFFEAYCFSKWWGKTAMICNNIFCINNLFKSIATQQYMYIVFPFSFTQIQKQIEKYTFLKSYSNNKIHMVIFEENKTIILTWRPSFAL